MPVRSIAAVTGLALALAAGCAGEERERGAAPPPREAVPILRLPAPPIESLNKRAERVPVLDPTEELETLTSSICLFNVEGDVTRQELKELAARQNKACPEQTEEEKRRAAAEEAEHERAVRPARGETPRLLARLPLRAASLYHVSSVSTFSSRA